MKIDEYENYLQNLEEGEFKDEYKKLFNSYRKLSNRTKKVYKVADSFDIKMFKDKNSALDESKKHILKSEASELASQMKSDFLANMSHEVRTPLNGILGFIQILKDMEGNEEKLSYLNIINRSSNTLLSLVNDILDFSKIESGKLELDMHDFDTSDELESVVYLFQANASEKLIDLQISISSNLPKKVHSDSIKIKQVISNLLSNAIKFTPKYGKVFFCASYDNDKLFISVKDTGIGISKEYQKTIFEAYTQSEGSTQRKFGGTGLGLCISHSLVEILNGELLLKSEENVGSEFYFEIPLILAKESLVQESVPVVFNNQNILVADDNPVNQLLMEILLQNMNLKCTITSSGEEAFEAFKTGEYELVLLDENMPGMSGSQTADEIRKHEIKNSLKHTPIISVTGNVMQDQVDNILASGMDSYIAKPVSKEALYNSLVQYL